MMNLKKPGEAKSESNATFKAEIHFEEDVWTILRVPRRWWDLVAWTFEAKSVSNASSKAEVHFKEDIWTISRVSKPWWDLFTWTSDAKSVSNASLIA